MDIRQYKVWKLIKCQLSKYDEWESVKFLDDDDIDNNKVNKIAPIFQNVGINSIVKCPFGSK